MPDPSSTPPLDNSERIELAVVLLAARDLYLRAQAEAYKAQEIFDAAEKGYCESVLPSEKPALVINEHVLVLQEDWYDLQPGSRVIYYTALVKDATKRELQPRAKGT